MKKLVAVVALLVVVLTIGTAIVQANGSFETCHEYCMRTIPSPGTITDYVECMENCPGSGW